MRNGKVIWDNWSRAKFAQELSPPIALKCTKGVVKGEEGVKTPLFLNTKRYLGGAACFWTCGLRKCLIINLFFSLSPILATLSNIKCNLCNKVLLYLLFRIYK